MADRPTSSWSDVWRLYAEHRDVFAAALADLRGRGVLIGRDHDDDLVHGWLLDRAPRALTYYRPDVGPIDAWLFVVFRRFVVDELRRSDRWDALLLRLETEPIGRDGGAERADLERVRAAVAGLDDDARRAVETFFRGDGRSVRAVARAMGVSRWKARGLLLDALEVLAAELGLGEDDHDTLRRNLAAAVGLRSDGS